VKYSTHNLIYPFPKFHENPFTTFRAILLTDRHTERQTNTDEKLPPLACGVDKTVTSVVVTYLSGAPVRFHFHFSFKKPRDVVHNRRNHDADEELGSAVDGPHAGVERPTDGHVSVDGDQQNCPDGHCLTNRCNRPHVPFGVREVRS